LNLSHKNISRIRGILFDKDGTLIDFRSVWIPFAFELLGKQLSEYGFDSVHKRLLLERIGLYTDGSIAPGSIYASGTVEDIAQIIYAYFIEQRKTLPDFNTFLQKVRSEVGSYMAANKSNIRTIGNAGETMAALIKQGFILGISTSDSEENTRICLKETGLLKYFDYLGCPDRSRKRKPSGDILIDFCINYGMNTEEVAIVGDTATDMIFAGQNHAGLAIGVLSGVGDKNSLAEADILLEDVNELVNVFALRQIIPEKISLA
jgi:phosphoglycolate phosphatase